MNREQLFLEIINNLCDGVYFVDADRRIRFWNAAAESITGYSAEEIVGTRCQDSKLNHIDDEGRPLCVIGCPLFSTIIDGEQRRDHVFLRHKNGYRVPVLVNIFPIRQGDSIVGAVEIFTQDSPTVYEDDLIEHLSGIAMQDPLTCLPNRRYLESFLRYKFDEHRRFGKKFAVLFADIDEFSNFNNHYGHETGDAVLKNIAASIKSSVRSDDLVGRWGGEEFVGVYSAGRTFDVSIIGEKFRQLVANTEVCHGSDDLSVSVSVGITKVRESDTIESVVERADEFMYISKRAGKDHVTTD